MLQNAKQFHLEQIDQQLNPLFYSNIIFKVFLHPDIIPAQGTHLDIKNQENQGELANNTRFGRNIKLGGLKGIDCDKTSIIYSILGAFYAFPLDIHFFSYFLTVFQFLTDFQLLFWSE